MWLLFLGPFFFLLYGGSGWIASLQPGIASRHFNWEGSIPFIPAMIVPYMSIGPFFAASLLLCSDRSAMRIHVGRIVFAIAAATVCFIIVPMRLGFERPDVDGLFGMLFGLVDALDRPYNQAPSLHIALLIVIWPVYQRTLRGPANLALHVWFALIGVSVLLTWQHHLIDVPTGALLGLFALRLIPLSERPVRRTSPGRPGGRCRPVDRSSLPIGMPSLPGTHTSSATRPIANPVAGPDAEPAAGFAWISTRPATTVRRLAKTVFNSRGSDQN